MARARRDLTGQRFGMLTVVRPGKDIIKDGNRRSTWVCTCDCGNRIVARTDSLITGNTQSCGCTRDVQDAGRRISLTNASALRLCTAILGQAADDYRELQANGRKVMKENGLTYSTREIERFFGSKYGEAMARFVADRHRLISDGGYRRITGEQMMLAIQGT